jgi:uncharacterized protein YjiK
MLPRTISAQAKLGKIAGYDFSDKNAKTVALPKALGEVSGLALTHDGRLLCHNDEAGVVFEVDYKTGKEVKRFSLGAFTVTGDFEGIAAKRDTLFLVNSSGVLYRFREGKAGGRVKYDVFKTPLTAKNEVEGLAYDPQTDCLLLACKGEGGIAAGGIAAGGKGVGKDKAVYAFSLKTYKLDSKPRFVLPLEDILAATGKKEFNPSAIERHPMTGNFFVLAYNGFAIIELDPAGKILGVSELKKSINPQPEGLAIANDGTIIIANEGQGKAGSLTIYSPRK